MGEHVEEDDPLVEIQTDKTTVEIPSPASGTVARILVGEGELVPVGTPLVVIGDGEAPPAAPRSRRPECRPRRSSGGWRAELGVDLAALGGTGPAGG